MNVFDVHVNRSPISGLITYKKYIPGSFFNASLDKASEENERLILNMDTENGKKIAFVQIAGLKLEELYVMLILVIHLRLEKFLVN